MVGIKFQVSNSLLCLYFICTNNHWQIVLFTCLYIIIINLFYFNIFGQYLSKSAR